MLFSLNILPQTPNVPQQQKRIALVIGNGNYNSSTLSNPENDARAMKVALESVGFTVMKYENLGQTLMKKTIDDFGLKLKSYDVGLFFYAGHGIQSKGYNYLIPVDAELKSEEDVELNCVEANRVLAKMEASGSKVNIVILDACRNNPFERSWTRSTTGRGLAFMDAPSGTLIAYSTAPGKTASDGSGKDSPYTSAILESIKIPNITIIQMFQNVRSIVSQKSGKQQMPWESTSMTGDFYFNTEQIAQSENQIKSQVTISDKSISTKDESQVKPLNETPALDERDYIIDSRDNERYKTVKIGTQVWMAENLKTTKYRNGDLIGTTTASTLDISRESMPKYQWAYDGNERNVAIYGRLYTWYAITDSRNVCPTGWHVPSDGEWTILTNYLGGELLAGGKLKEAGLTHWESPNTIWPGESGFTALPGGCRVYDGTYNFVGIDGYWWSSTEYSTARAYSRGMQYNSTIAHRFNLDKERGVSVRCMRDN